MTDNFLDNLYKDLSAEEKETLEKIQSKLFSYFDEKQKENREQLEAISESTIDFSKNHPDIIHSKNLTNSPNELIFTIRAEVSEINARGELESVVDIVEKFYHIPIKPGNDYKQRMDEFFEKFHNTLEETCRIINIDKKHEK